MSKTAMMECKKYSATIPERTCFLRFGEVKYYDKKKVHQFNGCKGCKIGSEVYERLLKKKESPVIKRKYGDKTCSVCERSMGASMFNNNGKGDICLDCFGSLPIDQTKTKVCSKANCKQEKPLSEFYKNSNKADGLSSWCKTCSKKATADNANSKKNKPKKKEVKLVKNETETEKEPEKSDSVLIIDFSLHKDLLERLMKKAEKEFRTVEQQILFDCNALTK